MLSFFPRDVLDEIWDLIESVSKGFPTYSYGVRILALAFIQIYIKFSSDRYANKSRNNCMKKQYTKARLFKTNDVGIIKSLKFQIYYTQKRYHLLPKKCEELLQYKSSLQFFNKNTSTFVFVSTVRLNNSPIFTYIR